MRTIGNENIRLVRQLTRKAIRNNVEDTKETVIEELPSELWDTWEMADQEIRNIIDETIRKEL